jgi:hypothetical protein
MMDFYFYEFSTQLPEVGTLCDTRGSSQLLLGPEGEGVHGDGRVAEAGSLQQQQVRLLHGLVQQIAGNCTVQT